MIAAAVMRRNTQPGETGSVDSSKRAVIYQVKILPSVRFGRLMPRILNVPGRTGILIHSGNVAADTTGCVLVGLGRAMDHEDEPMVVGSRAAFGQFYSWLDGVLEGGDVWVEVSYGTQ